MENFIYKANARKINIEYLIYKTDGGKE